MYGQSGISFKATFAMTVKWNITTTCNTAMGPTVTVDKRFLRIRTLVLCITAADNHTRWFHGALFINTLRPRQNIRHYADETFKRLFVNKNIRLLIEISLKFVPKGPINNIPALVQIMAWRRPGDKPLFEPMMVCLPTHICVTRPQWVNMD